MQHRNASLTPTGRLRLVGLVEEDGLTFVAAAAAANVAKSTVHLYCQRYGQLPEAQRPTGDPARAGAWNDANEASELAREPAERDDDGLEVE